MSNNMQFVKETHVESFGDDEILTKILNETERKIEVDLSIAFFLNEVMSNKLVFFLSQSIGRPI